MNEPAPETGAVVLRRFFLQLLAVSALLAGAGVVWRGLDFALAVLVGSLFVVVNFLWTRRVVEGLLLLQTPRSLVVITYFLKLGLTGFFLYLALVPLAMEPVGIVIGISSLPLAGLVAAGARTLGRGRSS